MSDWLDVDNGLPEIGTEAILLIDKGALIERPSDQRFKVSCGTLFGEFSWAKYRLDNGSLAGLMDNVTHFMPLPSHQEIER